MKNIYKTTIIYTCLLFGQTSEQIKQAKEIIQRTGMSESQVRDAAKARGYTQKQIDAAIQKGKVLQTKTKNPISDTLEEISLPELGKANKVEQEQPVLETVEPILGEKLSLTNKDDLQIIDELEENIVKKEQPTQPELAYFGYDIFTRDPALFQATSVGAVDPEYLIGPGDEIIVMLWGETQFRQVFTIDREGFVFIPEIGQVFVNGLNLNLLESKLFRLYSQSYASLNPRGRAPTSFLDVSLGNLRPLRIQVLGEVAQPGAYTVSPSATLFSSLYYFNGPTIFGSLRDIQLIRGGKNIASIDFYNYLLTGKMLDDIRLQLDDVIFIPKRGKTISVKGEVNRNAIFEIKEDEMFNQLLKMAGGLKNTAYLDRAQIDRIVPFDERTEYWNDRVLEDFNLGMIIKDDRPLKLRDGDQIEVFSIMNMHRNVIYITGSAVSRPGRFELIRGMRVADLIHEAGGLLSDAYIEKAHIIRSSKDGLREELISVDLSEAIEGNPIHNLELQWKDELKIFSYSEMIPEYSVSISGHVKNPGKHKLLENMTLYDLLFEYGGFVDKEFKNRTYLKRAELVRKIDGSDEKEIISFSLEKALNKKGNADLPLKVSDEVIIYSLAEVKGETQFVSIMGHVKRPGRYELFEDNMTVYDLLFKAGGFDDPIFKARTFLERADLLRFDEDRISKSITPFNLIPILSNKDSRDNFTLLPGDEIKVYATTVFNTIKTVTINGVVNSPGTYNLKTNMTLKDLILEAGGLNESIYRYRVDIARIDPTNTSFKQFAKVMTFKMNHKFNISEKTDYEDISNKQNNKIILKPYDLISIRSDPFFSKQRNIKISGMVMYPGDYTIVAPNEKISDLIQRAGGIRPEAYLEGSQFKRNGETIKISLVEVIKKQKTQMDFELSDGDEIIIMPKPNVVAIVGEVNNPGLRKFIKGKSVKEYVKISGDLNPDADRNNVWVSYPNGDSKKWTRFWLSPIVQDGSIINVGKKPESEPFDRTEFAKELTAILANLAQALAVVILAIR